MNMDVCIYMFVPVVQCGKLTKVILLRFCYLKCIHKPVAFVSPGNY